MKLINNNSRTLRSLTLHIIALLAALCATGTTRGFNMPVPFNAATALVQQGALSRGPNANTCGNLAGVPGGAEPFQYVNGNPSEPHKYQIYDVYNNGPAACRELGLSWAAGDCGTPELGLFIYSGSFNPNNITENLLAAGWQDDRGKGKIGGSTNLSEYRYSPGFDRHGGFLGMDYYTDWLHVNVNAPANANLKAVVVSKQPASQATPNCPTPVLYSSDLSNLPVSFSVQDTQTFESNPPDIPVLSYNVRLDAPVNATVSVDWSTANGVGANGGVAGVDYVASNGTVTFAPGEDSKYVSVPIIPNTTIQPSRTVRVLLSNPSPASAILSDGTGVGTIIDDDTPTCRFTAPKTLPNGTVGVNYGPLVFVPTGADAINEYAFSVATGAVPPGMNITVNNPPGIINATAVLAGTPTQSGTFNFALKLDCPLMEGGLDTYTQPFTMIIENGIPQVFVTVANVELLEGNAGVTPATLTVTLSAPRSTPTTFTVQRDNGTATLSNADFVGGVTSVTVPANQLSATFNIGIVGDTTPESNEQFFVKLYHTTGTEALAASATVTIINDDAVISTPTVVSTLPLEALIVLLLAIALSGIAWQRRG
jgi:hypothetical protein